MTGQGFFSINTPIQLGFDLEFQGFDDELADIASMYSPPGGCLLLAQCSAEFAGCVGLRPFARGICEMKRLYVRSEFRGRKIGRELACSIIEKACELGYKKMRLDTIASMAEANGLYRSLGFYPIEPYRYNPIEHALYYELDLMRPDHAVRVKR